MYRIQHNIKALVYSIYIYDSLLLTPHDGVYSDKNSVVRLFLYRTYNIYCISTGKVIAVFRGNLISVFYFNFYYCVCFPRHVPIRLSEFIRIYYYTHAIAVEIYLRISKSTHDTPSFAFSTRQLYCTHAYIYICIF